MIIGTGIDLVELVRIEDAYHRQPKFAERILTGKERALFHKLKGRRAIEFLAGRFAAKEAYVKARGTGIGKKNGWQCIDVLPDEKGKPVIFVNGIEKVHVSISHSKDYAIAQVIIEKV
ncbi:MAG: holo-ACP synthase [Bacillaceae bacterium]|nr:holo-ACP synthase [Bacillaceae bacterium]